MRKHIFYILVEPTGAGDEPIAVSYRKDNLTEEQFAYPMTTYIHEIGLDEFIETAMYLEYDIAHEMKEVGSLLKKGKIDFAERSGNVEKRQIEGKVAYRGYYTDPDGALHHRDFDGESDAYEWVVAERYSVLQDLQGGSFGKDRYYTVEEWREQAIDWLLSDGVDEENIKHWKEMPADKVIGSVEEWWDLSICKCK